MSARLLNSDHHSNGPQPRGPDALSESDRLIMDELDRSLEMAERWCNLLSTFSASRTVAALDYATRRADALVEHVKQLIGALDAPPSAEHLASLDRLRIEIEAFRIRARD